MVWSLDYNRTHGGPEEDVEEPRGDRDLGEVAERAGLAEADEGGERPVEAVEFAYEDVGRLRALKTTNVYAAGGAGERHTETTVCTVAQSLAHIGFGYCLLASPQYGSQNLSFPGNVQVASSKDTRYITSSKALRKHHFPLAASS